MLSVVLGLHQIKNRVIHHICGQFWCRSVCTRASLWFGDSHLSSIQPDDHRTHCSIPYISPAHLLPPSHKPFWMTSDLTWPWHRPLGPRSDLCRRKGTGGKKAGVAEQWQTGTSSHESQTHITEHPPKWSQQKAAKKGLNPPQHWGFTD